MNYLAHAYQFLDRPYFAAGTALPDWMSVIDRKNRARRQYAQPVTDDDDSRIADFAAGCVQHHDDDFWFHQNQLFVQLSTEFAVELRELLEPGMGHQAGFVGHISVELLLDSVLAQRDKALLDRYYQNLASIDAALLQTAANKICRKPVNVLEMLIGRFIQERFLDDYVDDDRLLYRLNGVMRRIKLPPLPQEVVNWLASARVRVTRGADELLEPSEEDRADGESGAA